MEDPKTPGKYLEFILQKSVNDLKREGNNRLDYVTVCKYFDYVQKAGDTLKAIYTLMHISKMKDTAVYLVFVLKKIKEGTVNFDTLDENTKADTEFIKGELLKNFSLSGEAGEEPELKIPEVSGSGLSEMVKENKFKVRSDDDASIAEEFSESELFTDEMFEEEIDKEGEISEEETVDESEQDTDTEDSEEDFSEDDSNAEEESDEPVKQKAKMSFGDDGFELISNTDEGEEGFEILAGNEIKKEQSDIIEQSEVTEQSEIIEQTDSETPPEYSAGIEGEGFVIKKTISSELDNEDTDETKEEIDEELHDEMSDEKTDEIDNQEKDYNEKDYDEEEFQESFIEKEVIIEETVLADVIEDKDDNRGAVTGEEVSEQYKDYEKTLFEVNELLKDYFLDIESVPEGAASPDGEPVIFGKISELCNLMENRSDTMSFSIISKVYKNTGSIFKEYLKANSRPNEEELIKLNNGINIVEGLIKGDDLPEADDVLASLEALKKSFDDTDVSTVLEDNGDGSEQEEQKEEGDTTLTDNEKKEIESEQYKENAGVTRKLNEKYSNSELRESFKHMKLQIQDLENTFLALDEIEGDYQNYEGLRKLSSTFLNLKEIIRCAKVLDLKNVAKLSEASYVFIKFIQNYRMNPFDEDIREIFKYIIYNFKAAALDKPNEDLERFISYLNDPVKIFTQKNKRK